MNLLLIKLVTISLAFIFCWYTFYIPLLRLMRREVHQLWEPEKNSKFLLCSNQHRPFHHRISFHLYIVTHDQDSYEAAIKWSKCCGWVTVLRVPTTKYFESIIYFTGLPQHEKQWKALHYVGVCTYRILDSISFERLKISLELAYHGNYHVVPLMNGGERLLTQGIHGHTTEFKTVWEVFLSALKFSSDDIATSESIEVFYRNSFIIKPEALRDMSRIMRRGIFLIEHNQTLSTLFSTNSHYREAIFRRGVSYKVFHKSYYEWHPFILERLPAFFLATTNRTVFTSLSEVESFTNPGLQST